MKNRDSVVSVVVGAVFCLSFCCEVCPGELGDPNSMARDPYPGDGEMNVGTEPNLTLSWSPGDIEDGFFTEVGYHVHVDINEANVVGADPLRGDGVFTEETSYAIENLEHETEYFWRIDTKLWSMRPPYTSFMIRGEVWSFRTMPEKAWGPEPADGTEDILADPNVTLSWNLGDFDARFFILDNVCYHVYYGASSGGWQGYLEIYGDTSVQVGPLMPRTTYYWRIDTNLASWAPPHMIYKFEGDVWSFTTASGPPRIIAVDDDGAADFSTIQAAIDDSNDGDTVLVADGVYTGDGNRDIDFRGKAITVKSENGPETCVIDCNGTEAEPHRGFYFHSGEDANSAIIGFTITNGFADIGGGILCDGANPSIMDCVITQNNAYHYDRLEREGGRGGGICCDNASPSVVDCEITLNVANDNYGEGFEGGYGGGIYCDDSNALISGCTLKKNESRPWRGEILIGGHGAGIYTHRGKPVISNCFFEENKSLDGGPTGTIHCFSGSPMITGCTVSNQQNNGQSGIYLSYCKAVIENSVVNDCGSSGIKCDDVSDGVISGCTIRDNSFSGILSQASNLTVSRCLIVENFYPGIECIMSQLEIRNCTISNNRDKRFSTTAAIVMDGEGACTIGGSILWNSHSDHLPIVCRHPHPDCSNVTINHSCVNNWDGTLGGVGNIGEDPMFADPGRWEDPCNTPEQPWDDVWVRGDYHLKSQGGRWDSNEGRWTTDEVTSPCIDGGDPMTPVGAEVFPNGGIINMGAYGGTAEASKSYFGKPPCETVMAGDVNGDCVVDFRDLQLMALHWME